MMHVSRTRKRHSRSIALAGSASLLTALVMTMQHLRTVEAASQQTATVLNATIANARSPFIVSEVEGKAAFVAAYDVFMHPRCLNCHPSGDAPLQGDDGRTHGQNVKRGPDGKGSASVKCRSCHQSSNLPGENMPPGTPNWQMTPPEMPMVFQGKSARELALQMVDPKQNGGKDLKALLHHMEHDSLVLWGWDPGEGRTKPAMTHEQFVKYIKAWIEAGAPAPD